MDSNRDAVGDVPAVYFVQPTEQNVKRIADDCKNHLYDKLHLNFVSAIPRPMLENLAALTLQSDSIHLISRVSN